jgi:hypothetical protein
MSGAKEKLLIRVICIPSISSTSDCPQLLSETIVTEIDLLVALRDIS